MTNEQSQMYEFTPKERAIKCTFLSKGKIIVKKISLLASRRNRDKRSAVSKLLRQSTWPIRHFEPRQDLEGVSLENNSLLTSIVNECLRT